MRAVLAGDHDAELERVLHALQRQGRHGPAAAVEVHQRREVDVRQGVAGDDQEGLVEIVLAQLHAAGRPRRHLLDRVVQLDARDASPRRSSRGSSAACRRASPRCGRRRARARARRCAPCRAGRPPSPSAWAGSRSAAAAASPHLRPSRRPSCSSSPHGGRVAPRSRVSEAIAPLDLVYGAGRRRPRRLGAPQARALRAARPSLT